MNDIEVVNVSIDRDKHTVLVVDDNPATRYSTNRVLRASGFRTVEAASGQEAIDQAAAHDISAVVLDVHLPDFDGFEVCRRLRAQPHTAVVPVIHLSATYVEDRHKVEGLNSGADAYITHPADPPILVATVQALVRARMAEDQVRRSEAKFRAIYTQAESGIALINSQGVFVEANPAMLKMLGRLESEVTGRRLSDFVAADWAPVVQKRLESAPDSKVDDGKLRHEAFSIRQPGGAEVHLEWSISPHVERDLRVVIASNVSERRALEQQRQMLLEREQSARIAAERHSQTKDDFIAVLSHELRNPLNAMLMGVHVLQRREMSPEVARGLSMIERNANTQARIISDILDVSRLNSGKLTLNREVVDPAALVSSTLEDMKGAIEARNITVAADLDTGAGPCWIDPIRFQQVLWNILSNAVKFSEAGGRIVVLLTRDARVLQLVVRDYGKGIEPAFLSHIFDKFAQGMSPENRAHGGLGLGMAIVKQLAELHGGRVKAESGGAGRGTTITMELPLQREPGQPPDDDFAESGKADTEADIQGLKVLVVEDDAQALEMLSMILRDRGALVATAASYAEAINEYMTAAPTVVVSDIGLPGKDGYDLIREIRRLERASAGIKPACAIALTAFGRSEDKDIALAAGFDAHLSKPLKPYKLLAAIAALTAAS